MLDWAGVASLLVPCLAAGAGCKVSDGLGWSDAVGLDNFILVTFRPGSAAEGSGDFTTPSTVVPAGLFSSGAVSTTFNKKYSTKIDRNKSVISYHINKITSEARGDNNKKKAVLYSIVAYMLHKSRGTGGQVNKNLTPDVKLELHYIGRSFQFY